MALFLGYDVGTSGTKAVLLDAQWRVVAEAVAPHSLAHPRTGWAEQAPEEWLAAAATTTRALLDSARAQASDVKAIAFAGQMLTLVPMDAGGRATRPAIAWMDDRGDAEAQQIVRRLGGDRIVKTLAGALPTGKDLVAKVAWLKTREPAIYERTRVFGDATSWLVARTTGKVALDPTAAGATGLFDAESRSWSKPLAWLAGFPLDRLAPLSPSTSAAGRLHAEGAATLGLAEGTIVATGLADIPAMAVGTGATADGEAHLYLGTSAWIVCASDHPRPRPDRGVAVIPSAAARGGLIVGECETAGACRAWALRLLGLRDDEDSAFDAMVDASPPGARGLLFCPWLFGERAPFPDSMLRGAFVGMTLDHGRADLARAVLEGVAMNLKLVHEAMEASIAARSPLRVSGGGALSDAWLQILADVIGRPLERVAQPRVAGAVGAALVAAVAHGTLRSLEDARSAVKIDRRFEPRSAARAIYAPAVQALRELAAPLSRASALLRGNAGPVT
ncbi:MAG: FGGY-family carbohydrate kinase [Polyangiales bacterium]